MLKRFYADNYRCFVNFDLRPERVCLLMGDNGSGKSTVYDALHAIVMLTRGGADAATVFPKHELTRWQTRDTQRFELDVEGPGGTYGYRLKIQHPASGDTEIAEEVVNLDGRELYSFSGGRAAMQRDDAKEPSAFDFNSRRSLLAVIEPSRQNERLAWFLDWLSKIWFFKLEPKAVRSSWTTSQEDHALNPDGSNFASFYRWLLQESPNITDTLRNDLAPRFQGFKLLRLQQLGDVRGLVAHFDTGGAKPYELPLQKLSDGQAMLIALYTIAYAIPGRATLLCFDEPDNYLALAEVQPWLVRVRQQIESSGTQGLFISHNSETIDYLGARSAYRLSRDAGGPVRVNEVLADLDSGLRLSEQVVRGLDDAG